MTGAPTEVGTALVGQFDRMVRRDGGAVSLLGVDDGVIRVGYRPGVDPDCDDGACTLPHVELQALMAETLGRRDPALRVVVELVP
jgi:hypothetical protein